jgi:hypothetical protein
VQLRIRSFKRLAINLTLNTPSWRAPPDCTAAPPYEMHQRRWLGRGDSNLRMADADIGINESQEAEAVRRVLAFRETQAGAGGSPGT